MHSASTAFVGINWGSTNFRAYHIDAGGQLLREHSEASGIAGLDRAGMERVIDALLARWDIDCPIYACGMVGSNIGWTEAPYAVAPAGIRDIAAAVVDTRIGNATVGIVPGIACRRALDGAPDILRGEEIELLGYAALHPGWDGLLALPGTHTKWLRFGEGRVDEFFTSMSGEMYDRLTAAGLLASIVDGPAQAGDAFHDGVRQAFSGKLGLATLLFGARARVIRKSMARTDAASYLRGLFIGAELGDALANYHDLRARPIPLIGNPALCMLYASALESLGASARHVESREACLAGFLALHRAHAA